MGEKIVIGPINKGLRNDRLPFIIDNDSFPTLLNAYQWRGRIKRKRGTELLTRLTQTLPEASIGNSGASPWTINTLYSTYTPVITTPADATIELGSVEIIIETTPEIKFIDQGNGILQGFIIGNITGATQANPCEITSVGHGLSTGNQVTISGIVGMTQLNGNTYTITVVDANHFTLNGVDSTGFTAYISGGIWTFTSPSNIGTINYLTGVVVLTHTAGAGVASEAFFNYYPALPVMGLEDFVFSTSTFPLTIAFDTTYAYDILPASPYSSYNVSYYKNPSTGTYTGYTQKTAWTPLTWNGEDYQQFYTVNYQGALWATNGIDVPFTGNTIGMQFKPIVTVDNITGGPPAFADLTITNHGLVVGDFLFINEVATTTGINFQTGYVTNVVNVNKVTVEFPNATIATNGSGGIAQYLTNRSDTTKDCIRWYDGDPTSGTSSNPTFVPGDGWVNFMPPLSQKAFSIGGLPAAIYYLVGARLIVPFKDRLLFLGPVVQTSSGVPIYLQDTIVYSQNGTAFYTCSYTNITATVDNPTLAGITFHPILVPDNQTATSPAYFSDSAGFGGFITAGFDQPIITVSPNEDVLILGFFPTSQARLIYTGNDILPFNIFVTNSEFGSSSTFSSVTLDEGVIARGVRGITITSQTQTQRIDLEIPDQVFEISLLNNGNERFTAQRDFINEWVYFTYPANNNSYIYPNQTLLYNYRDQSWGIFNECYTTYGGFRKLDGLIWATVGNTYPTWSVWNDPWDSGQSTTLQPLVIGGNQQGFVLIRAAGTYEASSLQILSLTNSTITSPNHCLSNGDFIIISGCIGTSSQQLNGKVFQVQQATTNTFVISPNVSSGLTYTGGGVIQRLYVPLIQTKQFPTAWGNARKTRLGQQQYLLTGTSSSQVTLLIFLSQNATTAFNDLNFPKNASIVPQPSENSSLIYSAILYTCPESTNLGLTPANINLQMVTAGSQQQIWHRLNTSLIGDTVQVGIILTDDQMFSYNNNGNAFAITGATNAYPCVLTCDGDFEIGELIQISGVAGMTQLNFNEKAYNYYYVLSSTATTVTIDIDSTSFGTFVLETPNLAEAQPVAPLNQTAEIELHAIILDVSPSMVLA